MVEALADFGVEQERICRMIEAREYGELTGHAGSIQARCKSDILVVKKVFSTDTQISGGRLDKSSARAAAAYIEASSQAYHLSTFPTH